MDNPYCSCKLTRVSVAAPQEFEEVYGGTVEWEQAEPDAEVIRAIKCNSR